jgi:flagellar biosynthesis protein FliR
MSVDLNELLSGQVFAFMMIFARVGTFFMLMPGIGEPFVLSRARLMIALAVTLLLLPVLGPDLPMQPAAVGTMLHLLVIEMIVGLFFGTFLRFLLSALEEAGHMISMQIGLSNAALFNPAFATQGSLPGAMLSTVAVLLLFSPDMQRMLLGGLVSTYGLFRPGVTPEFGDMAQTLSQTAVKVAMIGLQMAIPFVLIGLLLFVPLGVMNRLMPQLQVLVVAMPLQVGVGLLLFGLTITTMLLFWLRQFESSVHALLP